MDAARAGAVGQGAVPPREPPHAGHHLQPAARQEQAPGNGRAPDFRSARRVRHPELDRRVLLWVHEQLRLQPVTRLAIQQRAMDLARRCSCPPT